MDTETKTIEGTEETNTDTRTYTKEEVEKRVRGVASQVTEERRRADELQARLQQYETEKADLEKAELAKKEEWKTLLEKERTVFQEKEQALAQELESLKRTYASERFDRVLEQHGITDELIRIGVKAKIESDQPENLNDYLDALREQSPHLFSNAQQQVHLGVKNAVAGTTPRGPSLTPEVADQWLKSSDPEKRKAAADYWDGHYFKEKSQ